MSRSKLETLKTIFTSEYWLIASLCGAFFSFFALNRGAVVIFIDACFIFLFINFLLGKYKITTIPVGYWVVAGICGCLMGISVFIYPEASHYRWMSYNVRMLGIVFAIHCLSLKRLKNWVIPLFFLVLAAAVIWQFAAYCYFNMRWGTFTNPHYLASFTVLVLPAVIYYSFAAKGWLKFLFVPVVLLDFHLLLITESRPALLGLTAATLFVLLFLTRGKIRWVSILAMGCILSGVLATNYANVYSRLENLIVTLAEEERVWIWRDSWILLKDNTYSEWVVGNGIGVFRTVYPAYQSHPLLPPLIIFPHFFPLEILYDSGLIGVILVFGGIAALLKSAIKTAGNSADKKRGVFVNYIIVIFLTWLIHAGFSLPFYSKYSQYSLAFVLGTLMSIMEYATDSKEEKPNLEISPDCSHSI